MIAQGSFEGHPIHVVPGGLEGIQEGLEMLRNGKAGGRKFVSRVEETLGLEGIAIR